MATTSGTFHVVSHFPAVRFVYRQSFCSANFTAAHLFDVCSLPETDTESKKSDERTAGRLALPRKSGEHLCWLSGASGIDWRDLFTCISIEAIYVVQYGVY